MNTQHTNSRKALGSEHPDVLNSLENYFGVLRKISNDDLSVRMKARADAIRIKHTEANLINEGSKRKAGQMITLIARWLVLGLASLILLSVQTSAGIEQWQSHMDAAVEAFVDGDYAEAGQRFEAAVNEAETFGVGDPRLAHSLNGLAAAYRAQGRYAEAEPPYKRALAIMEKRLGSDHPDVAQNLTNYAALSYKSGGIIEEIRIEGTQRIQPEAIRVYIRVSPGDSFEPFRLEKSVKSIVATGLFRDVILRREGNVLIFSVVENPTVNSIAFEGNDRLDDETLAGELMLRPRSAFSLHKELRDTQRLHEIYRLWGFDAATVELKVIRLPQNRVDLIFEVNEGPS